MFDFFTTNPCGIKISDYAVEVMELSEDQVVETYGRKLLDEGIVEDGAIQEEEKLTDILRNLLDDIGLTTERAVLTLPSSQMTIGSFKLEGEDAEQEVLEKVDKNSQLFDFIKISSGGKTYVLYVVAQKEALESYKKVLEQAGLETVRVEPEQLALGRSLLKEGDGIKAVLNLGNSATTLSVFNKEKDLVFFKDIEFSNSVLVEKIADEKGISLKEAKHLKQKFGLNKTKRENKVVSVIKEEFEHPIEQIKDEIGYFEANFKGIDEIILSGKASLTPGLNDYLAEQLGKMTKMGNPLINLEDPSYLGEEETVHPVIFASVIGLSMSEIEDYEGKINLLTSKEVETEEEEEESMETEEEVVVKEKDSFDLGKVIKGVGITLLVLAIGVAGYFLVGNNGQKPKPKVTDEAEQKEQKQDDQQKEKEMQDEKQEDTEKEPEPKEVKMVTIKQTPTGWLRVRGGPGTINYKELDKVDPGKSFPFVSEKEGWYEIELPYGNGWVLGEYAKVGTTTVEQ